MAAVFPENEAQRIAGLHGLHILDTLPEADYDDLARLASEICSVPVALITLIDRDRQWFKARVGTEVVEIPREITFCGHAILTPDRMMVVEDMLLDPRFCDNPLVTGEPKVRFYAGVPIVLADGSALGTLCIVDTVPRGLPPAQARALQTLARQVAVLFELRRRVLQVEQQSADLQALSERRLAEQRHSAERLELVLRGGNLGFWELDLPGDRWTVNARELELLGYTEDDARPGRLRWRSLVHRADWRTLRAALDAHLAGESAYFVCQYRLRHRAGHWVWVQGHAVVTSRDAHGRPARIVGTHMDITGRRRERSALEHARDLLGRTGAMAQVGGWELDVASQRVHWSDEVYRIHEVERGSDPSLHDALAFYAPEARPAIEAALARALEDGTPWDLELPFVTARGRPLWVRAQGMAVHRRYGRTTMLAGAFQDITDRKRAELRVAESETRLRTITDNLPVLIAEFDTEQRFRFCNATYRDWLGADPEKMLGRTVQESVAPEYFERRRVYLARALAGEKVSFEQTLDLPIGLRTLQSTYLPQRDADGRVTSIYALTTDITALKDTQRLLDAMARTDLLTGLPNRRHFDERLAEAAARSRRTGSALAVLYLDVDRFKAINDTRGHAAGDDVLCGLAQRLRACLRETDLVARHAGDEFAILLEGAAVPADLSVVGAKLLEAMEKPLAVQGEPLTVGISIGATVYRGGEGSPDELLQRADRALYVAKTEGRGRFHLGDRA
ncbi:diguanylate cyclase domain-containing protein [Xylophilus sp. Leaf220]|uniref:sensor domain-containing diguanylate cyclase n=1 Tax=Xylophilus sp. Leaf220 TaxID=1735686 RepID=UPI0006F8178E|nr:diguanylate cyclase [Xylophilus sp. Leaf220]KQM70083.1 hypothetical protein ASE76_09695 [Xylophilus sp. Leaf220]